MSTERIDVEALRGHTPGPWYVEAGSGQYARRAGSLGREIMVSANVVEDRYGDGHFTKRRISPALVFTNSAKRDAANAALIAAAPDLLAEVIERRARDAAVAELVKHAHTAAARLWGSDDYHDRMAGDSLSDALAAVQGAQP